MSIRPVGTSSQNSMFSGSWSWTALCCWCVAVTHAFSLTVSWPANNSLLELTAPAAAIPSIKVRPIKELTFLTQARMYVNQSLRCGVCRRCGLQLTFFPPSPEDQAALTGHVQLCVNVWTRDHILSAANVSTSSGCGVYTAIVAQGNQVEIAGPLLVRPPLKDWCRLMRT
jgi:hypothetical protein